MTIGTKLGLDIADSVSPQSELRLRKIEAGLSDLEAVTATEAAGLIQEDSFPGPTNFTIQANSNNVIIIRWDEVDPTQVSDFSGFEVQFASNVEFTENLQIFNTLDNNFVFDASENPTLTFFARVRTLTVFGSSSEFTSILNTRTGLIVTPAIEDDAVTAVQQVTDSVGTAVFSFPGDFNLFLPAGSELTARKTILSATVEGNGFPLYFLYSGDPAITNSSGSATTFFQYKVGLRKTVGSISTDILLVDGIVQGTSMADPGVAPANTISTSDIPVVGTTVTYDVFFVMTGFGGTTGTKTVKLENNVLSFLEIKK